MLESAPRPRRVAASLGIALGCGALLLLLGGGLLPMLLLGGY